MSELHMDMTKGQQSEKLSAAINNMKQIRTWMMMQTQKQNDVQILLLNDAVGRMALAIQILLEKERGL